MKGDAQPVPPAAPNATYPIASLGRRYAAVAYEGLLISAIVLVTGFLTMPLVSPVAKAAHSLEVPSLPARALSACAVFGIAGVYFVWSWTRGRRTLPMKTWRIRLVRYDGAPVNTGRAIHRYLLAILGIAALGAGFFWALVDRDRQFLHDRLAGTALVDVNAPRRG